MAEAQSIRADDQLFRIGTEIAELVTRQVSKGKVPDPLGDKRAMPFCFLRSRKTYGATATLWREGYTEDAFALGRTIYELRLQALYLAQEPERGKLFMRHWYQVGWGTLLTLQRKGSPKWQEPLRVKEQEMRASTIAAGFPDVLDDPKAAEKAVKGRWWGKTLRDLAVSLGAEEEYDWVYTQLSDNAHSGVRKFHSFIQVVSESSAQMYYRPERSDDLILPWSVTKWLCEISAKTNEAYSLGSTDAIGLALELVNSFRQKAGEI